MPRSRISPEVFARRLKLAMIGANITQTELAEKSECSKAAISQYRSGTNYPGSERLTKLAEVLGVTVDYLTGAEAIAEPDTLPVDKINTKAAARCLGKSEQFVRVGLQRAILPFGVAVPGRGRHWNYYINPYQFRKYVGAERFEKYFGKEG